jgi:hemerythrin-like domain-containing protein
MTALVIEALLREHRDLELLLAALGRQIHVFAEGGSPDYDVVRGVADYLLEVPDRSHHPKEDIVFARLVEAHPHRALAISGLRREHRALGRGAAWFAETINALLNGSDIPRAAIVAAARSYVTAQRRHMREEEQTYFPLADRLLSASDWLAIEAELARRSDRASVQRAEQAFARATELLLGWQREDDGLAPPPADLSIRDFPVVFELDQRGSP